MSVLSSVADRVSASAVELTGKASTAGAITLQIFGRFQITEVNDVLTVVFTAISICYMAFKALNEIRTWINSRRKTPKD